MGFVRIFLASSVIAGHAGGSLLGIRFLPPRQAVLMFYVISGFYMALILNEKYLGPKANRLFYVNRYLRLWPTYIVVLIATLVGYGLFTDELGTVAQNFFRAGESPEFFAAALFSNLFILGQDLFWLFSFDFQAGDWFYGPYSLDENFNGKVFLLNPPAFTVSIELIFYLLAPHFLRSYKKLLAVLVLSTVYHGYLGHIGSLNLAYSYHFFPATLLYFSLGGLAYWIGRRGVEMGAKGYLLICAVICSVLYAKLVFPSFIILLFAFAIPRIFELTKGLAIDRFLGDLSYPLYIVHALVLAILRPRVSESNLGVCTLAVALVAALGLYLLIERPVDRLRQRYSRSLRGRAEASGVGVAAAALPSAAPPRRTSPEPA